MKIMSGIILVIILLKVTSVMSDGGCDCSALTFLKQIVQQEIFERKLEITMLRSELQKFSTGPRSIGSVSMEGSNIITRVEQLEQLVAVLKNTSDVEQQEDVENHVQEDNPKTNVNNEENLIFQAIVKQALKNEKLERMNFISEVQTQTDNLNGIVSDFKTTTDNSVNEQALKWSANNEQFEKNITQQISEFRESLDESLKDHVKQMITGMDKMSDAIKQFEKNTSNELERLKVNVHSDRETDKAHNKAILNGIIDNMTDVRKNVNECDTAIGLHKTVMKEMEKHVERSLHSVEELNQKFGEHLKSSEQRFSFIAEKVGICRGVKGYEHNWKKNWKRHGNKCYRFFTGIKETWFDALGWCREHDATLVEIESKEENDYVTNHMTELGADKFWIGLTDQEKEGAWKWNSAESTLKAEGFRNWAPSEPNNEGDEDCGSIYSTLALKGQWNDLPCSSSTREFVCQKSPEL